NKLYSKNSKATNKRIANMDTGEALIQSYLMGSYGALKYNQLKSSGVGTGLSAVNGMLSEFGNRLLLGIPGTVEYLSNRSARKN
ncbi:MAG: hypothetical protein IIW15_08735, partial [Firmicutes bacterium]|nr:hypothetical protein [Bacillota bacterium]